MNQPRVTKIYYNWHANKGREVFEQAEVGKNNVVSIGLHQDSMKATIYYNDGTIIVTNNVNTVFAVAEKNNVV